MAVSAFYFDLIVTGRRHRQQEIDYQERLKKSDLRGDQWQQLALELGGMSRSAMSIAERHVSPGPPGATS